MDQEQNKKLKGASPYNDKADNYNIEISDIMTEAQINQSNKNRLINFIILSFVKMYDFAQTRNVKDYDEAKRLLGIVLDNLNDNK